MEATGTWSTEIEYVLVQFLLVRICAEWEARIPVMFERRCSRTTDGHLRQFATGSAQYFAKRFAISDIGKTLGRFGADYETAFKSTVPNTEASRAWDGIYSNRKAVAHGAGIQMTFGDLKQAYASSLSVIDAIVASLGLTADETKDFV